MSDKDKKKIIKTAAFDVDGTLVHNGDPSFVDSEGNPLDGTPRYSVINLFHALEMLDVELYIWSSHGVEYSKMWRDKLGLEAKVVKKGSFKPDLAIDNNDFDLAKQTIKV